MGGERALSRGRQAFEGRDWSEAAERLRAAAADEELDALDLERLAIAAHLAGDDATSDDAFARAHRAFLDRGDTPAATRCGFWLGFRFFQRGEMSQANGWFARSERLIGEAGIECPAAGYLLIPKGLLTMSADTAASLMMFERATQIGLRFDDADLIGFGRLGQGQSLIRSGDVPAGMTLLDEVMVAVTGGEISTITSGIVYCAVLIECQLVFDLRRGHEWTEAMDRWCEEQPSLAPYRGQCLVHRSEILQLRGSWSEALEQARLACERLAQPTQPAIGLAFYQLGELRRMQGEFEDAERAFAQAADRGRDPQPGLALLRLDQRRGESALAMIERSLDETSERLARARSLAALVEIAISVGDMDRARVASRELDDIAIGLGSPWLKAISAHVAGGLLLADARPKEALDALRVAGAAWRELDAPYETARVRARMGMAYLALGDTDGAALEFEAARAAFADVGAVADLARLDRVVGSGAETPGGLSPREVEVLGQVAAGKTNRQIAEDMFISQKTVERHISNIFVKLGVSTRSAATAYAFEHDLLG